MLYGKAYQALSGLVTKRPYLRRLLRMRTPQTMPTTSTFTQELTDLLGHSRHLEWSGPMTCFHIVDGDTIHVTTASNILTVRLIAIDAPELEFPGSKGEFYASESARLLASYLLGASVDLARDPDLPELDPFQRSLCWVRFHGTNSNVCALMVAHGAARIRNDFPTHLHPFLLPLQARARRFRLGMWARP